MTLDPERLRWLEQETWALEPGLVPEDLPGGVEETESAEDFPPSLEEGLEWTQGGSWFEWDETRKEVQR